MLKGAQKRMIVVRTRDSRLFEEAYFVIRGEGNPADAHRDMLDEANRIIDSGTPPPSPPVRRTARRWLSRLLWFVGGAAVGIGATLLLILWP